MVQLLKGCACFRGGKPKGSLFLFCRMLAVGRSGSPAMGNPQLSGHPSAPLQPGGPAGNPFGAPMGGSMGDPANSQAFQAGGLTDPQNSVGAGALIGQLSTVSQATSQPSPPAVLPAAAAEGVQASNYTQVYHVSPFFCQDSNLNDM